MGMKFERVLNRRIEERASEISMLARTDLARLRLSVHLTLDTLEQRVRLVRHRYLARPLASSRPEVPPRRST